MSAELLWILAVAIVSTSLSIKRVGKNERVVILQNGKPVRLAGPGLVMQWPFFQSGKRFDVRPRSLSLPDVKLPDIALSSIVSGTYEFQITDPLKAVTNANLSISVEQVLRSTIMTVVSNATINQCFSEKSVVERQLLERVNRQTLAWGVQVTAISISEFRLHRLLIRQLAGMPFTLLSEVALRIEKVVAVHHQEQLPELETDASTIEETVDHKIDYRFGIGA